MNECAREFSKNHGVSEILSFRVFVRRRRTYGLKNLNYIHIKKNTKKNLDLITKVKDISNFRDKLSVTLLRFIKYVGK